MKIISLALLACVLFSCKNKQDEAAEKIEPVLKSNALQNGLAARVDSVKVYGIDTLTDMRIAQLKIADMNSKNTYYAHMADKYVAQSKMTQADSVRILTTQARLYNDSATNGQLMATALQRQIDGHKKDEKTLKGYRVLFKIIGTDKNNAAVKKDSVKIFFSPDLKVMPEIEN